MRRKIKWPYIMWLMILIGVVGYPLYATNTGDNSALVQKYYSDIQNVQIQLSSYAEKLYENKMQRVSNETNISILEFTLTQVNKLASSIESDAKRYKGDAVMQAKLQFLKVAADIEGYITGTLIEYGKLTDLNQQFRQLKAYYNLDSILDQIIIDFDYFETNPPY